MHAAVRISMVEVERGMVEVMVRMTMMMVVESVFLVYSLDVCKDFHCTVFTLRILSMTTFFCAHFFLIRTEFIRT